MAIPSQDLKKCTKCGEEKLRSDFYLQTSAKLGKKYPVGECKSCAKDRRRAYVVENYQVVRENDNKATRNRRAEVKDIVFAAYGGYECACCGETGKLFLTIDHINNDGAAHRREITGKRYSAGYHTYIWLVKNNFPSGYQVLCMNCNHGKRMNKGTCPHQVRCNDQSQDVEASASKRIAPQALETETGEDMVCSA